MVGVAQLVVAPGCGLGGRGFKSHRSPHKVIRKCPEKYINPLPAKESGFFYCLLSTSIYGEKWENSKNTTSVTQKKLRSHCE